MKTEEIKVRGTIQGVGFRPFVYRRAVEHDLKGKVLNTGEEVEIIAQGEEKNIRELKEDLKRENPPLASVETIEAREVEREEFEEFKIERSETSSKEVVFPPDIGICDDCVEELFDPEDRRSGFFMNSCTNCGPRYTVIRDLPYDRPNTAFSDFPMCEKCREEYEDPSDRRYYAQTTCCPECGPQLTFRDAGGEKIAVQDPIKKAAEKIQEGEIVAIKGAGGFHIASLTSEGVVEKLRRRLERPEKPFAVMARELEEVRELAKVSEEERRVLESPSKPITLLEKREDFPLADSVSPGLHTVGVMLPYTALQHLLLDRVEEPIVLTSANMPGVPMFIENEEAFSGLEGVVDFYLTHDLEIVNRNDDSVVKCNVEPLKVRRSRGYVPEAVEVNMEEEVLAIGAEKDNAFAYSKNGEVYLSQHIGDMDNLETLEFQRNARKRLETLTGAEPGKVVADRNPGFNSTREAEKIAEEQGLEKVQHHYAHIYSVMAEESLEEAVGIAIDGFGLGKDGNAWGGEVLKVEKGEKNRVGSLEEFPLPGLDKATERPERVLIAILNKFMTEQEVKELLDEERLEFGKKTVETVLKQVRSGKNVVDCTSAGRLLDAVSFLLDACDERRYEGEPAMKLEAFAEKADEVVELPVEIGEEGGRKILKLEPVFKRLVESGEDREVLAASFQHFLAEGLAIIAVEEARESGIDSICVSGGVCYNRQILETIKQRVEDEGLEFYTNSEVPPGDGGLALGQVYSQKF